jgi:hypothetical protein
MPNQSVPAADTGLPYSARPSHHRLGDRVVVEIVGTVLERIPQSGHYAIQPDGPRSSSIHVLPEYIFPEDSEPVLPPGLPNGTATIHAALRPMESPLSHADWNLTVLDLAFGHNRYDANGDVDQEWTAIGAQIGDALDFVREARKQFRQAWEAARGNSKPPQAPESPPTEPGIAVTDGGRAFLLLRSIIDQLHIEGDTASFTLTPELADELAAFGSESEDDEMDDEPEAEPDEDGHDHEANCWFEEAP